MLRVLLGLVSIVLAACGGASAADSPAPPGSVAPQAVEVSPPNWSTLTQIYTGTRTSIGGYPLEGEFGGDNVALVQGVVGAVQIPSSMTAINHSAGVAGYARTSSVQNMAVGLHGFGGVMADGGQAEGGHFLVTNCGKQACAEGVDASNVYIIEADINLMKTPRGNPTGNAFGIVMFGAGNAVPSGLFQAIHIDSPGVFQTPAIPWKEGIAIVDGAAQVGIALGKQSITADSDSQPLLFRSSAGGAERTSAIQALSSGDVQVSTGSGTMVVGGWGIRIAKAQAPTSSSAPCAVGQMQWDANYTYVCVATNRWRRTQLTDF